MIVHGSMVEYKSDIWRGGRQDERDGNWCHQFVIMISVNHYKSMLVKWAVWFNGVRCRVYVARWWFDLADQTWGIGNSSSPPSSSSKKHWHVLYHTNDFIPHHRISFEVWISTHVHPIPITSSVSPSAVANHQRQEAMFVAPNKKSTKSDQYPP